MNVTNIILVFVLFGFLLGAGWALGYHSGRLDQATNQWVAQCGYPAYPKPKAGPR